MNEMHSLDSEEESGESKLNHEAPAQSRAGPIQPTPLSASSEVIPRSKCVILVPIAGSIEPACEQSLLQMERLGYEVRRVRGYAAVDQARNQMATDAVDDGFEETLWVDSDVAFNPEDVERIRRHRLPLICGIYPKKGMKMLSCHVLPGTSQIVFGEHGGVIELLYAATGFLLVHTSVYVEMQRQLNLPVCNLRFDRPLVPYFQPMIKEDHHGGWYLAEDWAFCERARQCGYKIYADTTIRLQHFGSYGYTWEDAGLDRQRFATFTLNLGNDSGGRVGEL